MANMCKDQIGLEFDEHQFYIYQTANTGQKYNVKHKYKRGGNETRTPDLQPFRMVKFRQSISDWSLTEIYSLLEHAYFFIGIISTFTMDTLDLFVAVLFEPCFEFLKQSKCFLKPVPDIE